MLPTNDEHLDIEDNTEPPLASVQPGGSDLDQPDRKIRCGFRHPANFMVTVDGHTGTFNTPDEAEKFLSREARDCNMDVGSSRQVD